LVLQLSVSNIGIITLSLQSSSASHYFIGEALFSFKHKQHVDQ